MKLVELKDISSNDLLKLKDEIKVANKELSLANNRVLLAKEEYKEVSKKKDESEVLILKLNTLVEILPKIQTDILELTEKRDKLKIIISEMLDSSTLELTKAKEELNKITEAVKEKVKEMNTAEYKLKKFTDELFTHMNNYEIIRSRLETVYKTKFPELELTI